ncbi:SAF domain-containing protein [Belliella kenyensis]|uniref:SAF domain-containing protein n=1 Tax=Belliella kenyensis TaxID=1472724 RepID=A0ABV8EJF2_9BACT|nr:SAF domain-containing protein [Belliella kenyensis]MCH7402638.1 NAD(P)-dependent oxidoreductase [Belliella kenyensis]MDN3603813.1 NAD(P)-dependent oxidoreductase [Belliella kenyensis]
MSPETKIKVGIIGSGRIVRGLVKLINASSEMEVTGVLTRRLGPIEGLHVPEEKIYRSPEMLFVTSDVIVVSTGDAIYNTQIINEAFKYDLPVITMDADTAVTTGSWLAKRGFITEANGDQPGCLAVLRQEVMDMGFTPLVYGNIKGFMNLNPTVEEMKYWSKKQDYSLSSVTSFTDGTKMQVEQALVANSFGVGIAKQGLVGPKSDDFVGSGMELAKVADELGMPISDYILSRTAPPGVFIMSTHREELKSALSTYKMGDGPFYHHYKPTHLCFFEIPSTIKEVFHHKKLLMYNGTSPTTSVVALAKRDLNKGEFIETGIGGFELRGEAMLISDDPDHVPIGLLQNVILKENIQEGQPIRFSDVEIPPSMALDAWFEILDTLNLQLKIG